MENKDVLQSGMNAWNELSELTGDEDMTFANIEDFAEFYKTLCSKLFEIERQI